ncbi:hypothetical protein BLNAU_8098 [Blattamonas nauphoetae]|uniref:Uncharacterized protein n=1 Tax=Blattamonas nauphoetae TaxID=2049346 RepID=A0ABQ9XZY0_9EUKA|nr:hypothetical protein BLNAU_8098 [Blattamonas nauphoetae]
MKSIFAELSPSDGNISALSATLPSESPLLTENTVLELLCVGFSLLSSLLHHINSTFHSILIKFNVVPLLKSTIKNCLDLLEQLKTQSACPHSDRTDLLTKVLDPVLTFGTNLQPLITDTLLPP